MKGWIVGLILAIAMFLTACTYNAPDSDAASDALSKESVSDVASEPDLENEYCSLQFFDSVQDIPYFSLQLVSAASVPNKLLYRNDSDWLSAGPSTTQFIDDYVISSNKYLLIRVLWDDTYWWTCIGYEYNENHGIPIYDISGAGSQNIVSLEGNTTVIFSDGKSFSLESMTLFDAQGHELDVTSDDGRVIDRSSN